MKVSQELKIAIQAAATASREQRIARYTDEKTLVEQFMKKYPKKAQVIKRLLATITRAEKTKDDAYKKLHSFGVGTDYRGSLYISNDALFLKQGGKINKPRPQFKAEEVIAKYLAAATPKAANEVLKSYGIIWK